MHEPHRYAFSPHISRDYTDQQNSQPVNTLKNQGYHFEHNYGHGEQYLSGVFAMLMMLAFLVDQAQQLCCALFRAVWTKLGASACCGNGCVRCFMTMP